MSMISIYPKAVPDPSMRMRWSEADPIPDGYTTIEPPAATEGHTVEWDGDDWALVPIPSEPEPSLSDHKAAKLAALEQKRWKVETGGMSFASTTAPTHRDARAVVTAAYIRAVEDPGYTVPNYKVAPATFITLDAAAIIAYAMALEAHVQAAFDREAELAAEIVAAADEAALEAIDISVGWPG